MTISAILFDKDGTLIDYHRTWTSINYDAALLAARGDPQLANRLLVIGGWDAITQRVAANSALAAGTTFEIATLWSKHGSEFDVVELTEAIDQKFSRGMINAVPVTELEPLFSNLKDRGLMLGIASSDSAAAVDAFAKQYKLIGYLDFSAGYDSGHGIKPGPGMLLAFCDAVGCDPSETVVVGDNHHDMAMAESGGSGLRIAVLTGTGSRAELEPHSDRCIESIECLPEILASIEFKQSS
ncbi:MAG: HAD family hydrolase [Hyphomicrobiaceae bacterium]